MIDTYHVYDGRVMHFEWFDQLPVAGWPALLETRSISRMASVTGDLRDRKGGDNVPLSPSTARRRLIQVCPFKLSVACVEGLNSMLGSGHSLLRLSLHGIQV
ncbi:hypothetical protein F444_02177, partial [Phytophthora nicotianae P1976]